MNIWLTKKYPNTNSLFLYIYIWWRNVTLAWAFWVLTIYSLFLTPAIAPMSLYFTSNSHLHFIKTSTGSHGEANLNRKVVKLYLAKKTRCGDLLLVTTNLGPDSDDSVPLHMAERRRVLGARSRAWFVLGKQDTKVGMRTSPQSYHHALMQVTYSSPKAFVTVGPWKKF